MVASLPMSGWPANQPSPVESTINSDSSADRQKDPAATIRKLVFHGLGTSCEVQYVARHGKAQARAFECAVAVWMMRFEATYSRFLPGSIVSRINAAAGKEWVEIDPEMDMMLQLCDTLHSLTDGVLDPTILPLLRLWDYRAVPPRIPERHEIDAALRLVGWKKVERSRGRVFLPEPGMALDFGGFGKEYAVDFVVQLAADAGIDAVLVDFGHDLRAVGAPPGRPAWHVGLEDPTHPGTPAGSIAVTDRGVASSGDYLRSFTIGGRRYGHIIDPRTGWPVGNGTVQATVIAKTCLEAGVLSTTAFVQGVPRGVTWIQGFPGVEALVVTERERAQTRGFFNYVVS